MSTVGYDSRAVTIEGRRALIISGAVHYPRSTPAMWPGIMARSRQANLNTIETYVFWNLHERKRGVYDFSDRLDLMKFCQFAQENGLKVILRIGPYICAETNYGGFPAWLRDIPGMKMRTFNKPFMHEMEKWVRFLCGYLKPMFAPQGGPIILMQLENEYGNVAKSYGADGQRYMDWIVQLSQSLNTGVPLIMCSGAAEGAIETINGFMGQEHIEKFFKNHPGQPALWTENWPSWYDTFGYPHHVRTPQNIAYGVAKFFAMGGTGVNYYMWHGGTNFGRDAMFLQTTSYDFDAPLNEYGLLTTKGKHLGKLHGLLAEYAEALLNNNPATPVAIGNRQSATTYSAKGKKIAFIANDDTAPADVTTGKMRFKLPAMSVTIIGNGKALMNTAEVTAASTVKRQTKVVSKALSKFEWWDEPAAGKRPNAFAPMTAAKPIEQLLLTSDETDYCWYSADVKGGKGTLAVRGGDFLYVYVDGKLVAKTKEPLAEDRGKVTGDGFLQKFELDVRQGNHRLSILCCAMGLIKGDWMLGMANMAEERKGLWGEVLWDGKPVRGPWTMEAGLVGERVRLFDDPGKMMEWNSNAKAAVGKPLKWWKTSFARPKVNDPVVLDLTGMNRGIAWVNGKCIGRYWLIAAQGGTPDWIAKFVSGVGQGEPTQRYYHVPPDWIEDDNTVVLFEETGGDPGEISLATR